jgi:hypothetical protein
MLDLSLTNFGGQKLERMENGMWLVTQSLPESFTTLELSCRLLFSSSIPLRINEKLASTLPKPLNA